MLKGKTVVLGITGSIAAYKMANVASSLAKMHCDVQVIMTKNATQFITPLTFETLCSRCMVDTFDRNFQYSVEHVALAKRADLVLVAPATANIIANASSCPGSQSKITFLIFSPPLLPGVLLKIFLVLFDQGCFVPLFCLPYIQKRHFLKSSSLLAIAHSAVH